jgi:hypothetical protein
MNFDPNDISIIPNEWFRPNAVYEGSVARSLKIRVEELKDLSLLALTNMANRACR